MGRNNNLTLPSSDLNINLANKLNNYFHAKIGSIYSSLVQHNQATSEMYRVEVHPPPTPTSFTEFKPISCNDLE